MEQNSEDETDENALSHQVISIRTESSVLQEASERISEIIQSTNKSSNVDDEIKKSNELNQNELVRTGEITPFQAEEKNNLHQQSTGKSNETSQLTQFENYLKCQAELAKKRKLSKKNKNASINEKPKKKIKKSNNDKIEYINKNSNQTKENFEQEDEEKIEEKQIQEFVAKPNNISNEFDLRSNKSSNNSEINRNKSSNDLEINRNKSSNNLEINRNKSNDDLENNSNNSGSEYIPSDEENLTDDEDYGNSQKRKVNSSSSSSKCKLASKVNRILDDGDEEIYRERVRGTRRRKKEPMHKIDNLFKVPQSIWKNLYQYQRVSVQWLWELHNRNVGGLVGDEMGLGKTVQVIAFLAGLESSELLLDEGRFRGLGPTLIVCPATLLDQWVKHFHDWSPITRVALLHHSGSFQGDIEDLVESIKHGGILLTSYTGVLLHKDLLTKTDWHYVILDEGHKIRNPEAKVTKAVKQFSTPHRLLLTGSPMQNSLKELWSLFDFILPGKLGTLAAFVEHCANPITRGGYTNASALQEATALQMATMLRNAITPYMLRRTKVDVQHHLSLPEKNEQVLFCSLSEEQKKLYKEYLFSSEDVSHVIHEKNSGNGFFRARMLVALTALRKLCNHPDLFLFNHQVVDSEDEESMELTDKMMETFGHWKRAGKMIVVRSLLKIWKKQGHRVLLFTQSRQMMHILEALVQAEKYTYLRLDGMTPMGQRQQTIQKFNTESSYFVFLSTTRVGGLGVNLTGADRVVIYDPDWNPATDAQARERAWRIGQEKNVTIYRLITAGTIEEKIYHRQVFKLLLSNKVLEDPRQRRLFHTSDISELFNLNETLDGEAESDELFRHSKLSAPMKKKQKKEKKTKTTKTFSSTKLEEMRKLASSLSKEIGKKGRSDPEISKNEKNTEKPVELEEIKIENCDEDKNISENMENFDQIVSCTERENEKLENNFEESEKLNDNIEEREKAEINSKSEEIDEEKMENIDEDKRDEEKRNEKDGETRNNLDNSNNFDKSDNFDNSGNNLSSKMEKETSEEEGEIRETSETLIEEKVKQQQQRKKKKRKRKEIASEVSALFEGEQVPCLLGRRLGFAKENQEPVATEDDDYVLYKLFSKAAVSSAFQHDSVISNKSGEPFELSLLERTAAESAQEGMEKIRNSRKYYSKPSWKSN
ncbi:DNA excision repair protein ERCC-6-like [Leptopilina heterotoma]|uniref:DNA excision repair protein ERCC-6-like n=1 Tax=Leptopilina heterotoma TaxID=63436 RepID=UPI001CA8CEB8|nr:DNA excision repair protein ERCC-6-like [Leptopilina heterotoma]